MNVTRKVFAGILLTLALAGSSHAAKWKELVFSDDIDVGMAELTQYCAMNDLKVDDVLWANSVRVFEIKPGTLLYLPENHSDMLSIWQHKEAWKPEAIASAKQALSVKPARNAPKLAEIPAPIIPATTAGKTQAVKAETPAPIIPATTGKTQTVKTETPAPITPATNAGKTQTVKAETPAPVIPAMTAESADVPATVAQAETEQPAETPPSETSIDDILAKFRKDVRADERNLPTEPKTETPATVAETPEPVKPEKTASVPEKLQPAKTTKSAKTAKKTESPAKVIANTAKADKILTSKTKKSSKPEIPGLMDPIIIFSPNGDANTGPMRLIISGDKVEVVQFPKSVAPKNPSLADLNNSFGTNPSYLPHYDLTPKQKDPFILNMGNLAGKMLWPVEGKVTSPFGKWRGSHRHQGIDIPMPAGTPIRAARNGVVSKTGNNSTMGYRGYGNFVVMDHGEGVQTFYAHCLSIAVVQGQRVMQGQIIAYVGSTGRSTGNHLHFEVRVNNTKVDPMRYLAGNTNLASHK